MASKSRAFAAPHLTQKFDALEDNVIGLGRDVAAAVVRAMNDDLATAYTLYHQYKKHHWVVTGPEFRDLHLFLDEQAKGALEASDTLAERITALGGVPLSAPAAQQEAAGFKFEPEGVFPVRDMLVRDLEAEQSLVVSLRAHAAEAARSGDIGSQYVFMELLEDAEKRAHHLDHFLKESGLSLEAMRQAG